MSLLQRILKPNIAKLKRRKNVAGLIKALSFYRYAKTESGQLAAARAVGEVVLGAASALAELQALEAIGSILKCMERNPWRVWGYGEQSPGSPGPIILSEFGEGAVEPLLDALGHNYVRLRQIATYALGFIGDKRALPPLIAIAEKTGFHSEAPIWAIGKIGGSPDALDVLIKAFDGNAEASAIHAVASGAFGEEANAVLVGLLDSTSSNRVRQNAILALCEMGHEKGAEAALAEGRLSEVILALLGHYEDSRIREKLYEVFQQKDDDYNSRLFAAIGLAEIGDPLGKDYLQKCASDPDLDHEYSWFWPDTSYSALAAKALSKLECNTHC